MENKQEKKEIAPIDQLKNQILYHQKWLKSFFNTEEKSNKFLASCLYLVQKNPTLFDVERNSLINSFITCAEFGLYPWVSWEVYILPYRNNKKKHNEAQFQLGYQWMVTLLYKAWITSIYSDIVKKNDVIKIKSWTDPKIDHEYSLWERWEPIWVYVVCELNWKKIWKYMSKNEVLEFKWFSQSATAKEQWQRDMSPWNPKKDPELNMWKKTVLKQVSKLLPKTPDFIHAIEKDNELENLSPKNIEKVDISDFKKVENKKEETALETPAEELEEILDWEKVEDWEVVKVK